MDEEAIFRQKMDKQIDYIRDAIKDLSNRFDENGVGGDMMASISSAMSTSYGDRIRAAVVPVMKKVEENVRSTVTSVTKKTTP